MLLLIDCGILYKMADNHPELNVSLLCIHVLDVLLVAVVIVHVSFNSWYLLRMWAEFYESRNSAWSGTDVDDFHELLVYMAKLTAVE